MRYALSGLVLLLAVPAGQADETTLRAARQRWLRGNYEEARAQYESLARNPRQRVAATVGISQTWQSQGDYDKAHEVVAAALRELPREPDLLARRAELLHLRGRWDEALQVAEDALALRDEHFLARWVRAQVYRDRGDLALAETEVRWFVRVYTRRSDNDDDIKDPNALLLVGQAGAENARWNSLSDQFPFILNDVYADALKYDKDLWQAEYLSGMLLLEKYNVPEALKAFTNALAINPQAAEALVGKGVAALQRYEIREAEDAALRALRINPNLPEAQRLRADVHLVSGDVQAALRALDQARRINPRDMATLGRVAACWHLLHRPEQLERLSHEVALYDGRPGGFYRTLAEQLDERKHFDAAEGYYRKAIELRPRLPAAYNGLGLLYMRMGREDEARKVLTRAFENDAYNVRVANLLKVLRHLEKYQTLTTPHFVLRYDAASDKVLARFMARFLEETYAGLAQRFRYEPQGPILVEVFNSHDMFSGRVIGLPDLHTIGGCTGRMVALVSPRGKGIARPFNWARVLRHELVHIFNLEQSRFLVPHWFTEGLAVIQEGFPRPQQWNQLLLERVADDDLMTLDTVNLGFIRPRSPLDWHMAYCQSQLYVEYLTKTYGPEAVGRCLDAFAAGHDTAAVLAQVCKTDKAAFEKGYQEYVRTVAGTLRNKPVEKAKTITQLQKAHQAEPNNLEVAAQLAEQYLLRRRNVEARKLVDAVLEQSKAHPLASYVKARLLLAGGSEEEARKVLEAALDPEKPDTRVLQALGKLAFDAGDLAEAERRFELARKAEPYENKWLTELLRVATQSGDKVKQARLLRDLVATDPDDLGQRKRLAQLLLEQGDAAGAERYARESLEIDVLDTDAQDVLYRALRAQQKNDEAEQLRRLLQD